MKYRWLHPLVLGLAAATLTGPALADQVDEVRQLRDTTIALVNALVEQGVLTRAKADELIHKAEAAGKSGSGAVAGAPQPAAPGAAAAGAAAAVAPPGVIRVPYVPETVREQIKQEVKGEVLAQAKQERWGNPGALPQWLDRFSFNGDIRVRGQADRFPNGSETNATPQQLDAPPDITNAVGGGYNIINTTENRERLRLRARFGVDVRVADDVTATLRLTTGTTGQTGDPSTENENLGNYNNRGSVGFDRAMITYRPFDWGYLTAGRLGNPFFTPTTLVWGDDLSLQGIVVGVTPQVRPAFQVFGTLGAFPILDVPPSTYPVSEAKSRWLWALQTGFTWKITPATSWTLAAALYDYDHIEGTPNPTVVVPGPYSGTVAVFRQKGNTVFDINALNNSANGTQNYLFGLSSKFRELNLATTVDLLTNWRGKHVVFNGDYVKNLGFDRSEILARTGQYAQDNTIGMQARVTFGDPTFEHKHAWNAYLGYRHVESDAVVDAFTDSDFRLGGTDATGYYLGGRYAFENNTTIGLRWFSAQEIDGLPLSIDVLQIDFIAAF
jgi:Putative porin